MSIERHSAIDKCPREMKVTHVCTQTELHSFSLQPVQAMSPQYPHTPHMGRIGREEGGAVAVM